MFFILIFCLLLTACWDKDNEINQGTGDNNLTGSLGISWSINEEENEGTQVDNHENVDAPQDNTSEIQDENQWTWEIQVAEKGWTVDALCNSIIAFDICVISKAPIENQGVMQEQLKKSLEPRKILWGVQLHEVCQDIVQWDTFMGVVNHYASLENGCKFQW